MLITSDFVTPAELTGFARAALQDLDKNQFRLSAYLADELSDDLEYRFNKGGEGLVEAATFRAYDAESPIGKRPGIMRVHGELPPLSKKIRLGEYDRLRMRKATGGILSAIQSDAVRLVKEIAGRMELARGQAIYTGTVSMSENDAVMSVDFGRSGTHTVTAAVLWSDPVLSKPIDDLMLWQAVYVATNGERPGKTLISSATFGLLLRNVQFRELAGSLVGTPTIVSEAAVNSTLSAYGLPPFVINDEQINVAGVATRMIPANRVVFLPADTSALGKTLWGTTAESLEPDFGIEEADQPGIVAGSYSTKDPVALWTKAAAIGLPIVVNPNLTFTATVT
jgi:hypothetical protein